MDVPPHLNKFRAQLGTLPDFVSYVRAVETRYGTGRARVLMRTSDISGFFDTGTPPPGHRYLILKSGSARVVDFRHFFAAASQSYCGQGTAGLFGTRTAASPGGAMMLGLLNEIKQCIDESVESLSHSASARKFVSRIDSCFSPEDLGSNRLGALFGRALLVAEAEARDRPVSLQLREFLGRYQPATAAEVRRVKQPSSGEQVVEALRAILAGVEGAVFSPAY